MKITGIPSGDHECFCLLVTKETFRQVKGADPDEELDVGPFAKVGSPYRYMVDVMTILGIPYDESRSVYEITAESVIKETLPR